MKTERTKQIQTEEKEIHSTHPYLLASPSGCD